MLIFGCEDSVSIIGEEEGREDCGVYLNVTIQLNDKAAYSRGTGELQPDPSEIEGTDEENKIYNLYLLIFDWKDGMETGKPQVVSLTPHNTNKVYKVETTPGEKRVYAIANIDGDRLARIESADAVYTSKEQYYRQVINEFAPYRYTVDGEEGVMHQGIMMTGMSEPVEPAEDRENPTNVTIDLERVVAKILVTVKARTEGIEGDLEDVKYANAHWKDNQVGWMRLSDIYYFPNGTNKQLYYFKQFQENEVIAADPNMDLSKYLLGESSAENLYFDANVYKEDFVFYDQMTLYKNNASFSRVEEYNASKLNPSDSKNFYTEGMYCLENTFNIPSDQSKFEKYATSIPVVTSVAIAAKFTPRELRVEQDFPKRMEELNDLFNMGSTDVLFDEEDAKMWKEIEGIFNGEKLVSNGQYQIICANEKVAQFILTRSLKNAGKWCEPDEDYNNGYYPDATYFFNVKAAESGGEPVFYTYGAALDNGSSSFDFVPYTQGWGYYYTYIDTNGDGMTDSQPVKYTRSQIARNTYYILLVNGFSNPGNSITSPSMIKVNTTSMDWIYGGRGDIDLH